MNSVRPPLAALALAGAATTAQQVALTQVLGWMHWHHFAYFVVAVALLGFGMAGTVLSLARERLLPAWAAWLPWLLLGAAVTMPVGVRLAQGPLLAVDLQLVFFSHAQAGRLAALCLLLLPPFFCAGLATGLVLTVWARQAGRCYAASLAGAGAGGLVGLALVATVAPPRLPATVALLALAAAASLWPRLGRSARIAVALVALVPCALLVAPGDLRPSQFKPISRALDLPGARVIAARTGVHGWVQVVVAPALRSAPALSLEFRGEIPPQDAVFVNGLPYGSLPSAASLATPDWLAFTTDAAVFATTRPRRVLLLENGPGGWAALAAAHGAEAVTVVEPNRALVRLLTSGGQSLAHEWVMPAVTVVTGSARAFLRRNEGEFDLIRFPSVGGLGGTAGLTAAGEQFLLTREGFADAWRRLAPGGVLAATAWMDFPERNPPRLLATFAEMLEAAGVPPRAHLAAVRGWATVTFLARREPWTEMEATALRAFCLEKSFDPLLLPGLNAGEREQFNMWRDPGFFPLVDALVDGDREEVYRSHAFSLRPATDDRPYFSQFMRPGSFSDLADAFGTRALPFFELGSLVVALTFGLLVVLAAAGIALPLARRGWCGPGKAGVLFYFGGLGAGFMLAEIGLILRAQAWLGSPVPAIAVVLTGLLVASGVGSLWSERLPANGRTARRAVILCAGLIVVLPALLAASGPAVGAWPVAAQATVLLVVIGALGGAMGMAFPLGLRRLEATAPEQVPWAWAVNGCVSVATPAGAVLLAMGAGGGMLFVAAAGAYALAWVGAGFSAPSGPARSRPFPAASSPSA